MNCTSRPFQMCNNTGISTDFGVSLNLKLHWLCTADSSHDVLHFTPSWVMGFRPCSGPLMFQEYIHLGSLSAPASFRFKEFVDYALIDFVLNFFTTLAVLAAAAPVCCFVELPITFHVVLPQSSPVFFFLWEF